MKRALLAAGMAVLMTATACGDAGESTLGAEASTADASGYASGPITVEHHYGTTTLTEPPRRIVSLDPQWTDVLVALDAPLVGAVLDPRLEGGRYPWQQVPANVEGIPVTDSIPYEAVAALKPDLIVITWGAAESTDYDRLTQIAPTIPLLGDEEVAAWQDLAAVAGRVLGVSDEAEQLVADAERLAHDVAADLPGLEGKTYAMANYVPGDGIYVVADPEDGSAEFFAQLGLRIDPDLVALADGASGRAELSLERVDMLDADLLLLLTNGADPNDIVGYDVLPAVKDQAVAILDLGTATGLNTPSPASLPYSLDKIRPALEAAAT